MKVLVGGLLAVGIAVGVQADQAAHAQNAGAPPPAVFEAETSDVATLAPQGPHRLYLAGGNAVQIVNGDTGKIEGHAPMVGGLGNYRVAPNGSAIYLSESIWTKGNRGTRQDMISVYDGATLKLTREISLPGRLISTPKMPNFEIGADGRYAYVFNMQPASSVIVVDMQQNKTLGSIETPGCGMIYPWGSAGFSSLCADGSLASVVVDRNGKGAITHTPVFFDAENDPVFDESLVDRESGKALFITFSGMVHPASLSPTSTIKEAWSLTEAAGMPRALADVEQEAWRPGGGRFAALHRASGKMFVLMHKGKHWTQKELGTEVWVVDTATRKVDARLALPQASNVVAVSQDADPQLYVVTEDGWLWILDPQTGAIRHSARGMGRISMASVPGF